MHGIGQVLSVCKRSFGGEKATPFTQLFFTRNNLTLMLRSQDLAATVRTPIDASEAKKVLAHLKKWNGKVSSKWKVRATAHQKAMERGNALDYADVYKELSKLEKSGALRASDRAHLNQSLEFLVEELANALGKTPDQARKQIVNG